jgi:general secretion pathway protein E
MCRRTEVTVATAEPFDTGWVGEIEAHTRRRVKLVVANPEDVRRYTTEFYALARSVRNAQKSGEVSRHCQLRAAGGTGQGQQAARRQRPGRGAGGRLAVAVRLRPARVDIHLEPRRDMGAIRFRIDGVLHTVYQVPLTVMAAMTARIKLLGRMDVVEKRRPQDGRIKTKRPDTVDGAGDEVEMRLSTLPTAFGEKLVMRIFDPERRSRAWPRWASATHDGERWQELIGQAARHHPGHRAHRQRQDDHAVQPR